MLEIVNFIRSRAEEVIGLIGTDPYDELLQTSLIFEKFTAGETEHPKETVDAIRELVCYQIKRVLELIIKAEFANKATYQRDAAIRRTAQLREVNAVLRRKTQRDPLTRLYNKDGLKREGKKIFNHCRENRIPLSCLFIDMDFFKTVNDTYGHPVGDAVLQRFAETISREFREYDMTFRGDPYIRGPRKSVTGRDGGEEFVVLMPYTDLAEAATAAERLRKRIEKEAFKISNANGKTTDHELRLTCTIGVAEVNFKRDRSVGKTKSIADEALGTGKKTHRNIVCIAMPAEEETLNFEFPFLNDPSRQQVASQERYAN